MANYSHVNIFAKVRELRSVRIRSEGNMRGRGPTLTASPSRPRLPVPGVRVDKKEWVSASRVSPMPEPFGPTRSPSVTRTMGGPARTGRTELIGIGLHAARAAAAVKRSLGGEALDEGDERELELLQGALRDSAEVLRYGRSRTSVTRPRHLASVGLAIAAASPEQGQFAVDPEDVARILEALAADAGLVASGETPRNPDGLLGFVTGLVSLARNETASTGETLKRSES